MSNPRKIKTSGWYYKLELRKKTALWGFIFLLPWVIGFLIFFIKPLIEEVIYSFNTVKLTEGGISQVFTGLGNYKNIFTENLVFNRLMITMFTNTLPQVLIVIIFSLLAAVLLSGKFRGKSVARTIFFIPIIMGTNIATAALSGRSDLDLEMAGTTEFIATGSKFVSDILINSGLPKEIVGYIAGALGGIFSILAVSGVPVLIFLAAIQSISPSLYEVAKIEGATGYETFWKVTLPMVSPMILVSTIYTIIDACARHSMYITSLVRRYSVIEYMQYMAFSNQQFGVSAAMAVVYMAAVTAVVGVVSFLISRVVFYYD